MKRTLSFVMTFVVSISFALACGQKETKDDEEKEEGTTEDPSTPGTGTLVVSKIDQLPNVVDPVLELANDDATDAFNSTSEPLDIALAVSLLEDSGVSLGEDTKSDHYDDVSSPAYGSCEMVNRMRGILNEAATADAALCEFKIMFGKEDIPDTIVDGEDHIVALTEEGETVESYKINIVKANDKISSLTLHVCRDGSQELYLKKTAGTDGNVEIYAKRNGNDNNGPNNITYTSVTEVSGQVNDKGKFEGLKTMMQTYSNDFNSDGSDVSYNQYKVVQSADNIGLVGYATQTTAEEDDRMLSFFRLIDGNTEGTAYALGKLAVGAGAISFANGDSVTEEGWAANGSEDSDSDLLSKVEDQDDNLPTPPDEDDQEDLSFSGDEVWDCSGEADLTIADEDLDIDEDEEPCENFSLPQDQAYHLQCHNYK